MKEDYLTPEFKQKVHQACQAYVDNHLADTSKQLQELKSAAEGETKSTAGDKHETGRAMVHLEQEKLTAQLNNWQAQSDQLERIDTNTPHERIGLGCLVETDKGVFYLAIGIGMIKVEEQSVAVISNGSPIGKEMISLAPGESFEFNKVSRKVLGLL